MLCQFGVLRALPRGKLYSVTPHSALPNVTAASEEPQYNGTLVLLGNYTGLDSIESLSIIMVSNVARELRWAQYNGTCTLGVSNVTRELRWTPLRILSIMVPSEEFSVVP